METMIRAELTVEDSDGVEEYFDVGITVEVDSDDDVRFVRIDEARRASGPGPWLLAPFDPRLLTAAQRHVEESDGFREAAIEAADADVRSWAAGDP